MFFLFLNLVCPIYVHVFLHLASVKEHQLHSHAQINNFRQLYPTLCLDAGVHFPQVCCDETRSAESGTRANIHLFSTQNMPANLKSLRGDFAPI